MVKIERGGRPDARVLIRSHPGETATLEGNVWVARGADHVTLARLSIIGTGRTNSVKIYSDGVVVEDSDITNVRRGESCMILGSTSGHGEAVGTAVRRNRFYDCGSPENDNKDHAIYISNATSARIVGNVIWNTAGYAIHLYPNSRGARVAYNVIDGGGTSVRGGVLFGGNRDHASSNNVVERNIIAYAQTSSVTSGWKDEYGRGNLVRRNCLWGSRDRNLDDSDGGFAASGNVVAPPRFLNRHRADYRLGRHSRCRAVVGRDPAARLQRLREPPRRQ